MTDPHVHIFEKCHKPGYEYCSGCGTYHSTKLAPRESVYENNYWSEENGRSKLVDQVWNVTERYTCGISKVEKVLQYVPEKGSVLEIGCAPGVLLRLLALTGREAYGIEPDINVINVLKETTSGAIIIEGYFPEVFDDKKNNIFDCIVATDVFEHVEDYDGFIRATHRLLKPLGVAIIMSPIILEHGMYRKCDFEVPEQHAWLFSKKFLDPYLKNIFSKVKWDKWILGHEMIILTK